MTTRDLINTLKQGKPVSNRLVKEIIQHLELVEQLSASVAYHVELLAAQGEHGCDAKDRSSTRPPRNGSDAG